MSYNFGEEAQVLGDLDEAWILLKYSCEKDPKRKKMLKDQIVLSNQKFIMKYCAQYGKQWHLDPATLMSYGIEGLYAALDKYQDEKGTRFLTFAGYWIQKKIREGCRCESPTVVRLPNYMWDNLSTFKKKMGELTTVLARIPTYEPCTYDCGVENMSELEEVLVYSEEPMFTALDYANIVSAYRASGSPVSIDKKIDGTDSEADSISDMIEDVEQTKNRVSTEMHWNIEEEFQNIIKNYKDGKNIVAVIRGTILEDRTDEAVAQELGISRSKVASLKEKGMQLLRRSKTLQCYQN